MYAQSASFTFRFISDALFPAQKCVQFPVVSSRNISSISMYGETRNVGDGQLKVEFDGLGLVRDETTSLRLLEPGGKGTSDHCVCLPDIPFRVSLFTFHISRFTLHISHFTFHISRFTPFGLLFPTVVNR